MPHLHTEPGQHDLTASAFIARKTPEGFKILFHKHKKLGKFLQPGGHVELHENPWQAIQHELVEETGYDLTQLKVLIPPINILDLGNSIVHPHPVVLNTHRYGYLGTAEHFHTDVSYAFYTEELPSGLPDEGESTEFMWLTAEELMSLNEDDVVPDVRTIAVEVLTNVAVNWHHVSMDRFSNTF